MEKNYVFQLNMICAGSTSLCEALNILGIPSLHYRIPGEDTNREVFEDDVIPENIKLNRRLFYPYDEEWRGFLDFSGQLYHETLYKMYPNSKFIFTWRAYEPWFKSAMTLSQNLYRLRFNQDMPKEDLLFWENDRKKYWELNNNICRLFSKHPRFLTMKICDEGGDGWEKLCNFLEMPIPDVDFPKLKSNNFIFDNPVDK